MKDYEQIIRTPLARIADLEKIVAQQAAEITETKQVFVWVEKRNGCIRYRHQTVRIIMCHLSENLLVLQKIIRGRPKQRPGHNLLLRLSNHREEVLRFLHTESPTQQGVGICKRNHTFIFWLTRTTMFCILALPMI